MPNIVLCARRGVDLYAPVPDPKAPTPKDHWAAPVEPPGAVPAPVGPEGNAKEDGEPAGTLALEPPLGLDAFDFNATFDQLLSCPNGDTPLEQEVRDVPIPCRATFDAGRRSTCLFADQCPTRWPWS